VRRVYEHRCQGSSRAAVMSIHASPVKVTDGLRGWRLELLARADPRARCRSEIPRALGRLSLRQRLSAARAFGDDHAVAVSEACVWVVPPAAALTVDPGVRGGLPATLGLWGCAHIFHFRQKAGGVVSLQGFERF
jgi:hypothetical protein